MLPSKRWMTAAGRSVWRSILIRALLSVRYWYSPGRPQAGLMVRESGIAPLPEAEGVQAWVIRLTRMQREWHRHLGPAIPQLGYQGNTKRSGAAHSVGLERNQSRDIRFRSIAGALAQWRGRDRKSTSE